MEKIYDFAKKPQVTSINAFGNVNKNSCTVHVPIGCKELYKSTNLWKDFLIVEDLLSSDVNGDGTVDSADIVAVIKEMPDGDMKADVNGDGVIDSADIVAVIKAMK